MKPGKKRLYASLSIILLLSLFILLLGYTKKDQLAFHHYVKQFSISQLSGNALDLHYTLKNPEIYGIKKEQLLPLYQSGDAQTSYAQFEKELETLEKIDVSALSDSDALTYNLLHDYLTENMELEKYPYYTEPLTPNSGIHTTLPILLAEYTFSSTEDIETYLELLACVPDYLSSITLYEKEKAEAGLFMNEVALNKVVLACEEFAAYDDISEHLLYASFQERLLAFCEEYHTLSEEECRAYLEKNTTILEQELLPAYLALAENLTLLSPLCNKDYSGLCSYESGKEYYLALIKRNTGSYRSIQNIKEMLFADFEASYLNLISLVSTYPQLTETDCLYEFDNVFPLTDAEDILEQLKSSMIANFPPLLASPNVEVKKVSESLKDYCAPAFYLTVPMDDYEDNVIYLNDANSLEGLELYTTLAHEGFPGHLYQTVYFHNQNDTSVRNYNALLRNTLYFGGYTEGYALYVESLSYDYAISLCSDAGVTDARIICETLKNEWKMQISLYCLLDIAIHYDGATYEQVKTLLNKFGILEEESTEAIYQYLLEEPTTYLKYYLGYLEIENLKQISKGVWAEDYSDLAFHTFLLKTGPCNFKRLEDELLEGE